MPSQGGEALTCVHPPLAGKFILLCMSAVKQDSSICQLVLLLQQELRVGDEGDDCSGNHCRVGSDKLG